VIEFLKAGVAIELTGSYGPQADEPKAPAQHASTAMVSTAAAEQPPRRRWGRQGSQSDSRDTKPDTVDAHGDEGPLPKMHCERPPAKRVGHAPVRIDEPWLSWLVSGAKTHEGRLCRGTWSKLAPGHHLSAFSDKYSSVDLVVRDILRFKDFDEAFASLGKRLVPEGAETPEQALQLYRQWNSAEAVQKCGGVVAVEVQVGEVTLR